MNDTTDSLVKSAGEALLAVLGLLRRLHAEQQGLAGVNTVLPELETSIPVGSRWRHIGSGSRATVLAHVWVVDHEMHYRRSVLYRFDDMEFEGLFVAYSEDWTKRYERFQPS